MENAEIARVLAEIADVLELTGGNPFKVRAYRRAAQVVDVHPSPLAPLCQVASVRQGVWMARRGWLEAGDVLNTLSFTELRRRLARRAVRSSAAGR